MSIFDVQPPAWLTAIAKPADMSIAAKDVGMGLAAGINAAQLASSKENQALPEDQRKSWLQEIPQGLYEARMNMLDPIWKLKVEQHALDMKSQEAQLNAQMEKNKWQAQEHNWWIEEAPNIAKYMTDPNAPMPTVRSQQGIDALSNALKSRVNKDAASDFSDTVNELRKLDPVKAQKYAPFIGKPIPPQVYQQLGTDLDTARKAQPPVGESQLGKLQHDRAIALQRGDMAAVKDYDAAIEELKSNKGRSIYMGMDDQGKPIFQMTEGGGKALGPTVGMQTKGQEVIVQYQNATDLINWLDKHMTKEHVGARGVAGEFVIDRTLGQLFPEKVDQERVNVRTTLRSLRESLMRKMSDDIASGRFSAKDRDEIAELLPDSGVFESVERAKYAMNRVKEILSQRAQAYARTINTAPPLWSLTEDELTALVTAGQKSGLKPDSDEFKRKYITEDQALAEWDRRHGIERVK